MSDKPDPKTAVERDAKELADSLVEALRNPDPERAAERAAFEEKQDRDRRKEIEDFYEETGQKPFKETARARSIHEMHFAASLDPCPGCGTRIDAQQLSLAGGDESWALTGNCPRCGTPRAFTFLTYGDPLKAPCPRDELAGPKPSEIIPPGQWIAEIDRLLPLLRHDPTTLGYEEWKFNRDTSNRLLVCVNELLKFVPAGVSDIPVSTLSGEERADRSARPEHYQRAWIEEQRAQCLRLHEKIIADLPRIEKLESAGKGRRRTRNREVEFDHDALRAHAKWLAAGRRGRGRLILDGASGCGLRFPAAELTGAKLEDVDLSDCDLRFATFDEAELRDVNLVGAYLESASFVGAQIKNGSFGSAQLVLAELADATVEGTAFDGADLDRTGWHGARVVRADLERATFGNAQLDGATFLRCRFHGASFAPLDRLPTPTTRGARFEDCDLRHTRWDSRDLSGAVFIRCKLYGVAGIPSAADGIMIEAPDLSPDGDGSGIATAEEALAMWFPDRVVRIVPPAREVEPYTPCQSNEEERYQHCSICSQLADYQRGFQKRGREEQDTYLPAAAKSLQVVKDLVPECNGDLQLKQCPECATYYLYRTEYEFLYGGSEDEQELSRLTNEAAAIFSYTPVASNKLNGQYIYKHPKLEFSFKYSAPLTVQDSPDGVSLRDSPMQIDETINIQVANTALGNTYYANSAIEYYNTFRWAKAGTIYKGTGFGSATYTKIVNLEVDGYPAVKFLHEYGRQTSTSLDYDGGMRLPPDYDIGVYVRKGADIWEIRSHAVNKGSTQERSAATFEEILRTFKFL